MGHLINAIHVKNEFSLDRVIFIPSKTPVHKSYNHEVSSEDRYSMLSLAIEGHQGLVCSRIEIDRKTPSFTIYTINELRSEYPGDEFFLIIGSDSYSEIGTWKNSDEIISTTNIIVMNRKTDLNEPGILGGNIFFAGNPLIEVSSSRIREMACAGYDISFLIPESVERYIKQKGLYRN